MKRIFYAFILILLSCQPIELVEPVVFDNSQLNKISFSAHTVKIDEKYEASFADPFIDHSLQNPPVHRLKSWINDNIISIGKENKLVIKIIEASIKKTEINNNDAKKYEEKFIYKYELALLVEYNLYNNSDYLLASTLVENFRSTTSGKFISLQETENIIDDLILLSLRDFSIESEKLIKQYMKDFIL